MRKLIVVAAVILVGVLLAKFVWIKPNPPEDISVQATVSGQTLNAPRFPKVTLEFSKEFKYVGGQRFQLKGAADAEQHFWVEAEADGATVKRAFWVQYEGYLPSNDYTYDYSDERGQFEHSGFKWTSNKTMVNVPRRESDADSDGAKFRAYLRAKGLKLPQTYMRVRMITLDESKRNELMVIYLESPTAVPMKEPEEMKNAPPEVKEQLRRLPPVARMDWGIEQRARERFKVLR